MKKMMLTIVLLTFFSFWMLPADSKMMKAPHSSDAIPLSLMEESVDDMYAGCHEQMKNKVIKTYLPEELKDEVFRMVWNGRPVSNCVDKGEKNQTHSKTKLSEDQIRAICAYTDGGHPLYEDLNKAVRNGKRTYSTTAFRYHTLQFHLTEAIQTLRNSQGACLTSYRRTRQDFTGRPKQLMRFGQFASSSKDPNLYAYGKICFEMTTCYGADLKYYPMFGETEKEVLIPPYEVFEIVEMQKEEKEEMEETMKKCDKVFKLKNAGKRSDLNCKARCDHLGNIEL